MATRSRASKAARSKLGRVAAAKSGYVVPGVRRPAREATPAPKRTQAATGEYAPRIGNIVDVLGTQAALAEILGVDRSRITRWAKGEDSPSEEAARDLVDLDHLVARAKLVLHKAVIKDWLTSPNQFIQGTARPVDAIRSGHAEDAVRAIRAEAEGAYA